MKNILKIFLALFLSTLVISCNKEKHEEEDGHNHGAETTEAKEKQEEKKEEHSEEEESSITSLTQEQIKTVGVTYGKVEMKELTATIRANGNLRVPNDNKANATSLYGGVIKSINVQVGDYVRKGQVIATITNPEFIQLQEEYLTTTSQITYAVQEYNRQKELFNNNAGARKNLQSAETELRTLRTKKASLQKQIQLMGISPSRVSNSKLHSGLAVTAPISGTISNVIAQIGSYVDVSFPVAEIVNNASLHLDLNVFEKDLPMLTIGQTIHFTITNNPTNEYDAEVYSIGSAFENQSKTIPVHARVKGNTKGLINGMNITGIVSLNDVLTPAVPNDAVVDADGKSYIFIVTNKEEEESHDEEGHEHSESEKDPKHKENTNVNYEKIEVAKGVSDLGYTAITPVSPIPENAKIVTKGAFFINAKMSNSDGGHAH